MVIKQFYDSCSSNSSPHFLKLKTFYWQVLFWVLKSFTLACECNYAFKVISGQINVCFICFSTVCPAGEQWRMTVGAEFLLCERSCWDIYSSPDNCSHFVQGCICQEGLYRNTEGVCVIPALCPCRDQGILYEVCAHTPCPFILSAVSTSFHSLC